MVKVNACPNCGSGEHHRYPYEGIDFRTCDQCALVYMADRPDDDALWDHYYTGEYMEQREAALAKAGSSAAPRARRVSGWIAHGKSHLDVGCAEGHLLRYTHDKGFDVLGVEPCPEYTFEEIPTVRSIDDVEGVWDNITCIHVLEHVADFKHMARRMIDLLSPGGLLIVEVPGVKRGGPVVSDDHLYYYPPAVIKDLFGDLTLLKELEMPYAIFFFTKE